MIVIVESAARCGPLGVGLRLLEWSQRILLSRSGCGGLRSSPGPALGGRSHEDKARIASEIVANGDSVRWVVRRHGLLPQQLFGWRRQSREAAGGVSEIEEVQFVPAMVDVAVTAPRC